MTMHDVQVSRRAARPRARRQRQAPAAHHQAINWIGSGRLTVAWTLDQVVEAVELQGHKFGIGVQWTRKRATTCACSRHSSGGQDRPRAAAAEVPTRSKRSSKRHAARS